MFRIDADDDAGRFTRGNPSLASPATIITDDWANGVQEEIIKPIEEMGITLVKGDEDQLWLSLLELALRGGRKIPISHTLANNTVGATVANFPLLNKSNHLMRAAFYYIERKTDTQSVQECGLLICRYNSKDDEWSQEAFSLFDVSGVSFEIDNTDTDAAVLKATTDDLTGTSYVGNLKLTQLFEIKL